MSAGSTVKMMNRVTKDSFNPSSWKTLYRIAGIAALAAMSANLFDVVLGFGETEVVAYGSKSAIDWFALYQVNWFTGLYRLGFMNLIYMVCLMPVYWALFVAHRQTDWANAALAVIVSYMSTAIYLANNAAIPMLVLAEKYASASTDAQRALLAAAGEAVLVRGEDFTPGAFIGLLLGSIAALAISVVMLRGGVFGKLTAWIGLLGFTFLSLFIIWATFIPVLYAVAYYVFGMIGGLCALAWFVLVARKFFALARTEKVEK